MKRLFDFSYSTMVYETRIKIIQFLRANKGRWFTAAQIANSIGRGGKLITAQLDSTVQNTPNIYCDRCIVRQKTNRLFYGWFENVEHAKNTFPEIEELRSRSFHN